MAEPPHWRSVYDFWFPQGLAEAATHRRMIVWWFDGGANAVLQPYAPTLRAASAGRLEHWNETPQGRLSLILTLDQFPRGLFAGTHDAYAADPQALQLAEQGIVNGQYDALLAPWEKTFFLLPLAHAEGPGHVKRLRQVVALTDAIARNASAELRAFYEFSAGQARGNLEVITRFGRFPHRNPILGRPSTTAERRYLEIGDFVHNRRPSGDGEGRSASPQPA